MTLQDVFEKQRKFIQKIDNFLLPEMREGMKIDDYFHDIESFMKKIKSEAKAINNMGIGKNTNLHDVFEKQIQLNESIVPRTNAPRQQELTPEQMMAAREAQNNPDTGEQQGEVKSNTPDELSSSFANTSLARDPDQGTDPQGKPPDDKKK